VKDCRPHRSCPCHTSCVVISPRQRRPLFGHRSMASAGDPRGSRDRRGGCPLSSRIYPSAADSLRSKPSHG
jgi:hypothetical protein